MYITNFTLFFEHSQFNQLSSSITNFFTSNMEMQYIFFIYKQAALQTIYNRCNAIHMHNYKCRAHLAIVINVDVWDQ